MQLTVTLIGGSTRTIDLNENHILTRDAWQSESIDPNPIQVIHIDIPEGVTAIGLWPFGYCSSLASVTLPNSVTSIAGWAFRDCTSLASVTIPAFVTEIGQRAFQGCTILASVTMPDSVTSIAERAFQNCTSLASVTIPYSVKEIELAAFEGCTSLERIIVHTDDQKQMLLNSESGITDNQIVCLPELTEDEGNRKNYGTTYSRFAALNPQEQDLYLAALYKYRAQHKNAASTGASNGIHIEADTFPGSVTTRPKAFLNILREKYNDATRQHVTQQPKVIQLEADIIRLLAHAVDQSKKTAKENKYRRIADILDEPRGKYYDPRFFDKQGVIKMEYEGPGEPKGGDVSRRSKARSKRKPDPLRKRCSLQ